MAKAARASGHFGWDSGSPRGTHAARHRRRSLYDRLLLRFESLELRRLLATDTWTGAADDTVVAATATDPSGVKSPFSNDAPATGLVDEWNFASGTANDLVGTANGTLYGGATISNGMLQLNGSTAYMATASGTSLGAPLAAKTLVAWVSLATLSQSSGSALTVENTTDPDTFDAIDYAERVPYQWMAGSDSFARSPTNNGGALETVTSPGLVMLAIVYGTDNSVTLYRDGVLYAGPYTQGSLVTYPVATTNFLIGVRHDDRIGQPSNYLQGSIREAQVWNEALTASDVLKLYNMLMATAATIAATEGAAFSGSVATFSDSNLADDLSATITWDDGSTSAGTISAPDSNGIFTVTGTHIFADETIGAAVSVAINDAAGVSVTAASVANVSDAPLTAGAVTDYLTQGTNFSGTVATFTDANSGAASSDFTAAIDWGDSTTTTGTVSAVSGGGFAVSGSHLYAQTGTESITVTIDDVGGATATADSTAIVQSAEVVGDNNLDQVDLTAQNDGTVSFQVISGSTVVDSGTIAAGMSVPLLNLGAGTTVIVNGTAGDDIFALSAGKLVINGVTLDATGVNANIASWQVNGLAGDDTFTVNGAVGAMSIDGGSGANVIQFASGSSLTGTIGGSGNTLDYTAYGAAVNVNLSTGVATATGGVSGITTVVLGDGASSVTGDDTTTLVGPHETSTWNLTSATAGTIVYVKNKVTTTITYAGIANLVGGAGNDTFQPAAGVLPAGSIDGGAGTDTLTFSKYASTMPLLVDLHGAGVDGAADTVTSAGTTRSFANIESIVGDASTGNALTGPAIASTWTLTAAGTGKVGGISFSKFPTLVGWSGGDTLVGPNLTNTWPITALDAGSVAKTAFSGMANLVGGTDNDTFQLKAGGSLSGTLDGGTGTGTNTLDYTNYFATTTGSGVTVDLVTSTANGIAGGFSSIQAFKGSKRSDTLSDNATVHTWTLTGSGAGNIDGAITFSAFEQLVGSGGDTLIGANATANWVISGSDAGSYNTKTLFVGMANLTGGSGADTFTFNNAAALTGVLDGGAGTNAVNYAAYATTVVVNLDDGSATGVANAADGMLKNIANATGGKGTNVLVGNTEANVLIGGKGRNLIIGGGGANTLTAGPGEDLLIAGTTSFDMNDADLALIAAEWFRTDRNFATRVADLSGTGSGGYTGPYLISDLSGTGTPTVFDNAAADTLNGNTGAAATDWFFASAGDVINNGIARDETTDI